MFKILRIVFSLLSALCLVPVVLLGVFKGIFPALACVGCAIVFFLLALLFKTMQENQEERKAPKGDFFSPQAPEREEENGKEEK